jgi:3-hydroxyacyl-[acyl-carrier-protein] dehydratase
MTPTETPTDQKGNFFFDPKDPIYDDHFPGQPVVPGSLIIAAFLKVIEEKDIQPTAIHGFRFKAFVSPGSYTYKLVINTGTIDCSLLHNGRKLASGKILYEP